MTETQALLWIVGVIGSVMAGAITLDKVLDIVHKYVKKAKAPDDAQNKRLDAIETRLNAVEVVQREHKDMLSRDLQRFGNLEEAVIISLKSNRALLGSQLTGNNVEAMKESASEIDNFLFERRQYTWKQS